MSLYSRLAGLPVEISGFRLEPLQQETVAGWNRHTTVVRLEGCGHQGQGEDVGYSESDQLAFQRYGAELALTGRYTLDEFSHHLDALPLMPVRPSSPADVLYRRWALESAALDLALRQSATSLADALGRTPAPVAFAVSLGLGDPATPAPLLQRLEVYPGMRFKVDLSASWTEDLVAALAQIGVVDTVDLKGQYRGAFTGPPTDPEQYRWVAELLPEAWIEDPDWSSRTELVFEAHRRRISWDAIIHSVADIAQLPFEPACINMKPSRFGMLSELLRAYEYCEACGITMYGGGQFELGPGRGQIQYLASLFHPDAANDVAPPAFNDSELRPDLPVSPLPPAPAGPGFLWT